MQHLKMDWSACENVDDLYTSVLMCIEGAAQYFLLVLWEKSGLVATALTLSPITKLKHPYRNPGYLDHDCIRCSMLIV